MIKTMPKLHWVFPLALAMGVGSCGTWVKGPKRPTETGSTPTLQLSGLAYRFATPEITTAGISAIASTGKVSGRIEPRKINLTVKDLRLTSESTGEKVVIGGPFAIDLLTGTMTPEPTPGTIPVGVYNGIELLLGANEGNRSVDLEGDYVTPDGRHRPLNLVVNGTEELTIVSAVSTENRLEVKAEDQGFLYVGLPLRSWFDFSVEAGQEDGADMRALDDEVIVLDGSVTGVAAEVRNIIKTNIGKDVRFGRDEDSVEIAPPEADGFGFVQVAVGAEHSCGLTATGAVLCWGDDSSGQLGNGPSISGVQHRPVLIDTAAIPNVKFKQIATSNSTTCALATDGRAFCWGNNENGSLGSNYDGDAESPVAVDTSAMTGAKTFRQITVGAFHGCGVATDDVAYCWGINSTMYEGATATNDAIDHERPTPIVTTTITGATTFTTLSAGYFHTCGITTDGVAYCWGADKDQTLGNGPGTTVRRTPSAVDTSGLPVGARFTEISAGLRHSCGIITAGQVYCWGTGFYGELGSLQEPGATLNKPGRVPIDSVQGEKVMTNIIAAMGSSCAISKAGRTYCWGGAETDSIGSTTPNWRTSVPQSIDVSAMPDGIKFKGVAMTAASRHGCTVGDNGVIYCWGHDNEGQLGNGAESNESKQTPTEVVAP